MTSRYPSGQLVSTPPTLDPARGNAADGIYTLSQYTDAVADGVWPGFDPYFRQTVLLLHGNGTDGAQNNTFLDGSANNFTVTRNGNATQGAFSPFVLAPGLWSAGFNGSSGYLSFAGNAAFAIATTTTPWTVEAWVYPTAAGGCIFSELYTGSGSIPIAITMSDGVSMDTTTGLTPAFGYYTGSAWVPGAVATTPLTLNQWSHVACVFTGSTCRIYINGINVTKTSSPTPATTWLAGVNGDGWLIGRRWDTFASPYFSGYITSFRFVNGTAVYTSDFTPPTAPLTAITNTVMLTCQNNRYIDNSASGFAVTGNGGVSASVFSRWAPTAAYNLAAMGSSGYFDGAGDYLTIASNSATALQSNNFTLEFWVYLTNSEANALQTFYTNYTTYSSAGSIYFGKHQNTGGRVSIWISNFSTSVSFMQESTLPPPNAWTHYALVRNGNTISLYRNGTLSTSASFSGAVTGATNPNFIVAAGDAVTTYNTPGYFADYRLVVGTAVYTSNFTPPTAPLTVIANTQLFLAFDQAGIIDSRGRTNLETVGNAQIDTAIRKFGSGSIEMDGSGDYLSLPSSLDMDFGTGDFTVETWLYLTAFTAGQYEPVFSNAYLFYVGSSGEVLLYNGSSNVVSTSNGRVPLNTWTHIAWVRQSGVITIYVNGISAGSATVTAAIGTANPNLVGRYSTQDLNGYIDEFRITKGVARYTANFAVGSPPTAALPVTGAPYAANTVLLLPGTGVNAGQNNTFLDSSTSNLTITRNGNATQGSFSPFARTPGSWTVYYNNISLINTQSTAGGWLQITNSTSFDIGTGNFTLEGWIYALALPASDAWPTNWWQHSSLFGRGTPSAGDGYNLILGATRLIWQNNDVQITSGLHNIQPNAWYHVAACRSSGTLRLFVNGTVVASSTTVFTGGAGSNFYIGSETGQGAYFAGYMSNVRLLAGTAAYTANFTPATQPFPVNSSTTLLTCQSNRFLDASTNSFAVASSGDVRAATFSLFPCSQPAWSNFFDGSADYLSIPSNSALVFASGDFTVECWFYLTGNANPNGGGDRVGQLASCVAAGPSPGWEFLVTGNSTTTGTGLVFSNRVNFFTIYAISATTTIAQNQWNHVAAVRSGATTTLYLNGQSIGSGVLPDQNITSSSPLWIGRQDVTSYTHDFLGYISNFRVVKGTAMYTGSTYTVPTAPLVATPNTTLLTCQSSTFRDNSVNNFTVTAVGNTSVSPFSPIGFTEPAPYSTSVTGGSGYFDGDGDWLEAPTGSSASIFGTGDFTIEFWVYNLNAVTTNWNPLVTMGASGGGREIRIAQNINGAGWGFLIPNNSNNADRFFSFGALPRYQWHHIALVRNGANVRLYRNGVDIGGVTDAAFNYTNTGPTRIAYGFYPTDGFFTGGYLTDVRIVKGTAVYTANFLPPPGPLTAITNTTLLTSCTNATVVDQSMFSAVDTINQAQISSAQSRWGGGSLYFDGVGDRLIVPNVSGQFSFGTGDFTVSAWIYITVMPSGNGYPASYWIVGGGPTNSNTGFDMAIGSTNLQVGLSNFAALNIDVAHGMTTFQWYYVLVCRQGNILYAFRDSTLLASANVSGVTADPCLTGLAVSSGEPVGATSGNFLGYIQDLRVIKGVAAMPQPGQTSQWQDQ